jgi:hypothetical protein
VPFHEGRDLTPITFTAQGTTPLGEALDTGLDLLAARKSEYKEAGLEYVRPWLFVITDGMPTDGQRFVRASRRVRAAEAAKEVTVFTVGAGEADLETLSRLGGPRTARAAASGSRSSSPGVHQHERGDQSSASARRTRRWRPPRPPSRCRSRRLPDGPRGSCARCGVAAPGRLGHRVPAPQAGSGLDDAFGWHVDDAVVVAVTADGRVARHLGLRCLHRGAGGAGGRARRPAVETCSDSAVRRRERGGRAGVAPTCSPRR